MKLQITYKGYTIEVDEPKISTATQAIIIIEAAIDKINASCTNCTCEKSESYGKNN